MTNEQTVILLKKIKVQLKDAVEKSESLMPDSERITVQRHGRTIAANFCISFQKCNIPHHYYDSIEVPALDPIYEVIASLNDDIALLTPKEGKP